MKIYYYGSEKMIELFLTILSVLEQSTTSGAARSYSSSKVQFSFALRFGRKGRNCHKNKVKPSAPLLFSVFVLTSGRFVSEALQSSELELKS